MSAPPQPARFPTLESLNARRPPKTAFNEARYREKMQYLESGGREIDMGNQRMNAEQKRAFYKQAARFPTCNVLYLTGCDLGDDDMPDVAALLLRFPDLIHLYLARNRLTDKGLEALLPALLELPLLSNLSLQKNVLTDVGFARLRDVLPKFRSLEALFVGLNQASEAGARMLIDAAPSCPTLQNVFFDPQSTGAFPEMQAQLEKALEPQRNAADRRQAEEDARMQSELRQSEAAKYGLSVDDFSKLGFAVPTPEEAMNEQARRSERRFDPWFSIEAVDAPQVRLDGDPSASTAAAAGSAGGTGGAGDGSAGHRAGAPPPLIPPGRAGAAASSAAAPPRGRAPLRPRGGRTGRRSRGRNLDEHGRELVRQRRDDVRR